MASTSRVFRAGLLDGQVAIVSGGGSGLGRAIALELAGLGAHVVICGRRAEALQETAAGQPEGRIHPVVFDIREEDEVNAFVDGVLEREGRIDVLVNNAGGQFMAPAEDISPKGFRAVIRLNVEGTWLMTHTVATRGMIPAGAGRVISVTLTPHHGQPGFSHSGAARAAVENLMRVLSIEWARYGVRLNAVAVGHFGTETLLTKYPEPVVASLADSVPLGRLGEPEEVAWLVAYLASPAGDFISGTVLTVDGARDDWMGRWPPADLTDAHGAPLTERRPRPRA